MNHFNITHPTPNSTMMTCPAYTIFHKDEWKDEGGDEAFNDRHAPSVKAGRTVYVEIVNYKGEKSWNGFHPNSVVSYALQYSECPIAAIEDCKSKMKSDPFAGHKLHWFNPKAVMITDSKQAHETFMGIKLGEKFRFEGRIFSLKQAANYNVDMIDHGPAKY